MVSWDPCPWRPTWSGRVSGASKYSNWYEARSLTSLRSARTVFPRGASFGDLGADSLALIELVEALEKELGGQNRDFRIDDEDLEDLKTVRDAVDYVVAKLGSAS